MRSSYSAFYTYSSKYRTFSVQCRVGKPRGKPLRVPRRGAVFIRLRGVGSRNGVFELQNCIHFVQICSISPKYIQILLENKIINDFRTKLLKK